MKENYFKAVALLNAAGLVRGSGYHNDSRKFGRSIKISAGLGVEYQVAALADKVVTTPIRQGYEREINVIKGGVKRYHFYSK